MVRVVGHDDGHSAPVAEIPASDDEGHIDFFSRHFGQPCLERIALGASWRV